MMPVTVSVEIYGNCKSIIVLYHTSNENIIKIFFGKNNMCFDFIT